MKSKIIFESDTYRIVEIVDKFYDLENLKGDCFNPEANPDINADSLRADEIAFENLVNDEGVFGYELEKWDGEVGKGWTSIDGCWGFVGSYSETNDHYIVGAMKRAILADIGGDK